MAPFLRVRSAVTARRIADGGYRVCELLSDELDAALRSLAGGARDDVEIVAVGGYGRRELSPFSDVDLMLLHPGDGVDDGAKTILYPLWDAGLKVGHSVRTPDEAVETAKEDFATLTSLLTARLVAGSGELLESTRFGLARYLRGRPLAGRLAASERQRRAATPYPVMAADVKDGRGGLRTLQGIEWERRRRELLGDPVLPPCEMEVRAKHQLLAIRNALHAATGQRTDVFSVDVREPAARWLGVEVIDAARMVTESMRTADRLAVEHWPDLLADRWNVSVGRRLRRRFSRRQTLATANARPLAIAAGAAARSGGVSLSEAEQDAIRNNSDAVWTEDDVASFLSLLEAGGRGRVAFGWLDRLGWLDRGLPEIVHTIAAPQLAPFHEHPVDTHLWRTVDEMRHLLDGDDPWFRTIGEEVDSRATLLIASFLHDVGKAKGGDHSEIGAEIAQALCDRIGSTDSVAVAKLVRLHLLLPESATKRDTADPEVIADIADQCGSLWELQSLYLLAVADARATGRTMWSGWKATLLKNLYLRVAGVLEPDVGGGVRGRIEAIAKQAGVPPESVSAHLTATSADYLSSHANDEVACHVRATGTGQELSVEFLDADATAARLVVVCKDRSGLLAAVAGVLTLHNLQILDARIESDDRGFAFETFHVARILETGPIAEAAAVAHDLRAALTGELDLTDAVATKVAPYRFDASSKIVVRTPIDPTLRYTAVEIRCADRPGALFRIASELNAAGLDIRAARIESRGDEVRDLFYVWRDGAPLGDVNEVQPVIAGLRRRLRRLL